MKSMYSFVSLLVLVPTVSFAFSDVPSSNMYNEAISSLQAEGILQGYSDNTFKPNSTLNRAEFSKIAANSIEGILDANASNCFKDVKTQWYANAICSLKNAGVVNGYTDGYYLSDSEVSFKPEQTITFAEASKILSRAYKQDIQSDNIWYKGYVLALSSSKAIPTSITALDKPITRGEMAEIMWRLKNNITTKPSANYYGIKYPDSTLKMDSNKIEYPTSCADLDMFIKENETSPSPIMYMDGMSPMFKSENRATAVAAPTAGAIANDSFSKTNVQVEGIDEADTVKTDGTYIYSLQNNLLAVTKATPSTNMKVLAEKSFLPNYTINNTADTFSPQELYVTNGYIVLIGQSWNTIATPYSTAAPVSKMAVDAMYRPQYQQNLTQARLYTFTESKGLELVRTVSIEGSTISTRVYNNNLYLVASKGFGWYYPYALNIENRQYALPVFSDSASQKNLQTAVECNKIGLLPHTNATSYISIATVPLTSLTAKVSKEVIMGNGETVYMSQNNMYLTSTNWNYTWGRNVSSSETTNVYRFMMNANGSMQLASQGSVKGHILNQWSLDEYNNTFRIATTSFVNTFKGSQNRNNLYILNMNLESVGSIEDIAPNESIHSVRFMGDRTYMVTFQNTDPFFVIDTSEPRNPKILGALKIPGYSDYLHPYDATHILGFGKEAEVSKDGNSAWYQGMKVAMFDVTDVKNPTLLHNVTIGDRGTSSPLLYNHKALLFDKERNLLAFPVSIYTVSEADKKANNASAYGEQTYQGAIVYDVSIANGFTERGRTSHYTSDDTLKMGSYYYGKDIERIIRIGSSLYTLSATGIQSLNEKTVTKEGEALFTVQPEQVYPIMY